VNLQTDTLGKVEALIDRGGIADRLVPQSALDEALELLRKLEAETKDHTADGTPHGEPYCCCPLCHVVMESDLGDFLAKHQPPSCERCGGDREIDGPSCGEKLPCPECREGELRGANELARAAELAPKVAELSGLEWAEVSGSDAGGVFYRGAELRSGWTPLDPNAFQAVLLALPNRVYLAALDGATRNSGAPAASRDAFRWLFTPAGMLAFYEALAEVEQ
jgi:hypothetical protein